MTTPIGDFGAPEDVAGWVALALGGVAALAAIRWRDDRWLRRSLAAPSYAVGLLAAVAATLSAGYVLYYLRGAPRIIDATSYLLQARTLAEGSFTIPIEPPTGSYRGRFLVTTPAGDAMAVIFPPGFAAAVAPFALIGVPMASGPVIAAALVAATHWLALRAFDSRPVALFAAALSVVSAALRYHTADTMSHGFAALLMTASVASACGGTRRDAAVAGLATGWLVATRPITGAVTALVVLGLLASRDAGATRPKALVAIAALGAAPGAALWCGYQWAVTGDPLGSTQLAYYALADGPPGCFRYGFGDGIGCVFEHGSFVTRYLPNGYGPIEALGTTLRRLRYHLLDVANLEVIALLIPMAAYRLWSNRRARWLVLALGGVVAGYAPFYFDGSYPGGGARLFADAIPVGQALVAWIAVEVGLARWLFPAALGGFALHASFDHRALAEREGGRPMFERAAIRAAGAEDALVFVSTDHGFNLGFSPARNGGPFVARSTGGAREYLLWRRLGRPRAFRYELDPWMSDSIPSLVAVVPGASRRQEAEAEWPVLAMRGGWAHPEHFSTTGSCESNGRGLRLRANAGGRSSAEIEVAVERAGLHWIATRWVSTSDGTLDVSVSLGEHRWGGARPARAGECLDWTSQPVWIPGGGARLEVESAGENAILDFVAPWPAEEARSTRGRPPAAGTTPD